MGSTDMRVTVCSRGEGRGQETIRMATVNTEKCTIAHCMGEGMGSTGMQVNVCSRGEGRGQDDHTHSHREYREIDWAYQIWALRPVQLIS